MKYSTIRRHHHQIKYSKLIGVTAVIGVLCALLAICLKHLTEFFELQLSDKASFSVYLGAVFPFIGLSLIYVLRQYAFRKKPNKGITEIFECTKTRKKNLPIYKIPLHVVNGFLTVIFGGSTGIEVSTVVASATVGSVAQQKTNFLAVYKVELVCAGVAAGIAGLFSSPIAGLLFAYEVISKKRSRIGLLMMAIAVTTATMVTYLMHEHSLFSVPVQSWHYHAIPHFIALGVVAGAVSTYLTKSVMIAKKIFATIETAHYRILLGGSVLSLMLILAPALYGDGYHAMKMFFANADVPYTFPLALSLLALIVLKPLATSVTLASGGDGGVFAPSLFLGAFLGLLCAIVANRFLGADVVPLNFMVIGMAAILSASIHAPLTALFLVCGLVNDYTLFAPILVVCFISKYTAKMIYPHTVYTLVPSK